MSSFRGRPGHLRAFSRAPPPLAQHPCGRSGGRECSQCAPPACDRQLSCGWLPSTSLSPPDPPCPGRPLSTAHPHTRTLGHTPDGTSAPRHHSRRAAPGHHHNHHHHHHQRCTTVVRLPATTTAICNTKYLPGCAPYHTIPRLASPASPRAPDLPPSPFPPLDISRSQPVPPRPRLPASKSTPPGLPRRPSIATASAPTTMSGDVSD